MRILIVEDNPADALMLATLLEAAAPQAELSTASDGDQAVQSLLGGPGAPGIRPDLILMDLNLPRKNGFEVLATIRAEPSLRQLPVFMLTTSASPEDLERARALGVINFVTKPVDLDEMEATVQRLVKEEFPKLFLGPTGGSPQRESQRPVDRSEVTGEGFRLLVEAVKDYAIFMLDPHGYILTWNEGAQRIKQYAPSDIIGKHFSVFYPPDMVQSGHPDYELRVAEKEGRYEEEGWRLRKDGTRFWASVTITAIRDHTGTLIGFGKVTRDMSERRLAEERLRESEERFRVLVDGVRDYALFLLDPSGHIVSWNTGAERINGYKASEILGKHFSIFYTEQAKSAHHPDKELQIASQKGVYEEEGIRVRKDGATFWANVVITSLFDQSGNHTGFAKITRDITERKKAEEEVRRLNTDLEQRVKIRTAELEESKRALERQQDDILRSNNDLRQFAYVASHDLQEPLRTVVTYLQFLQRRNTGKLDGPSLQYVDFAVKGALRMKELIEDLLSYARIERSGEPLEPVDFSVVVKEALSNLAGSIDEAKARVTVDELPIIRADYSHMVQLFQNLIGNAVTYRAPERPAQIRVSAQENSASWTFSVSDNGIGISPEYWQRVFEIFQRLHSDRDKYPGTGIGLAICKKIVERHGGRIDVESVLNEGTTFRFTLPKISAPHEMAR